MSSGLTWPTAAEGVVFSTRALAWFSHMCILVIMLVAAPEVAKLLNLSSQHCTFRGQDLDSHSGGVASLPLNLRLSLDPFDDLASLLHDLELVPLHGRNGAERQLLGRHWLVGRIRAVSLSFSLPPRTSMQTKTNRMQL